MDHETLYRFLVDLSKSAGTYDSYQADKEKVMTEAGLTNEEQALLMKGDEAEIRKYLGDECACAAQIKLS